MPVQGAPVTPVDKAGNVLVPAGSSATAPAYQADGATNKADRSNTASTTSQTFAPANTTRKRLLIQNQDAAINVFVNLGAAATTGQGSLRVGPGGFLDIEGTTQALNIIAASGTPIVTVWEF
jgi:hypothetical protein